MEILLAMVVIELLITPLLVYWHYKMLDNNNNDPSKQFVYFDDYM